MKTWVLAGAISLSLGGVSFASGTTQLAVDGAHAALISPHLYKFGAVSTKEKSAATLAVVQDNALGAGVIVLDLTVNNSGNLPIGLSSENIRVTTDRGELIPVLSYNQMAVLVHKRLGGRRFATGFGNVVVALAAASAGQHTNYGNYSGTSYTPYGSVSTFGTVTTTTYDPYEAAAAHRNAANYIASNNASLEAQEESLDSNARQLSFSPSTIFPNGVGGTLIPLQKLPNGTKHLSVTITLSGDVHTFELSVVDRNSPKISKASSDSTVPLRWPAPAEYVRPPLTDAGVNAWISDHVDQRGWNYLGYDNDGAYLVDLSSIEAHSSGKYRAWFRSELFNTSYKFGLGLRSSRYLLEIDCQTHLMRQLSLEAHPLNNLADLQITEDTPDAVWSPPPTGTAIDNFTRKLCANRPS